MFSTPSPTRTPFIIAGLLVCVGLLVFRAQVGPAVRAAASMFARRDPGFRRVEDRVREYGDAVRARLAPDFARAGVPYPPAALALLAFKQEKTLEVYAAGEGDGMRFVRSYPVLAASGQPGPKLREGDLQVPEGLYRIESLNPNSLYHLALRVDYPNAADRAHAAAEQRTHPGGDIMIHGSNASVGCLAMGDPASEDLFVLAALTGIANIRVVMSPLDFRAANSPAPAWAGPPWMLVLYDEIRRELARYPRPGRAMP